MKNGFYFIVIALLVAELFKILIYYPCCFEGARHTVLNHHSTNSYSGIGSIERTLCDATSPLICINENLE